MPGLLGYRGVQAFLPSGQEDGGRTSRKERDSGRKKPNMRFARDAERNRPTGAEQRGKELATRQVVG